MGSMRVLVAATLLLFSTAAYATTYQVGPTRTMTQITQAMASAGPGDVVQVDGNATYAAVRWTKSGTAAQPIRIVGVAASGMRPRIQGGANTVEIEADYVVMEGFDISGGSSRGFFQHGDHNTLRDSVVHDCPKQGILGADQDSGTFLLEYVEVHHCGGGTGDHQIYMATDEVAHPGSVFRMQYCYVHDANGGNSVKSRAERNEIYYNWIEGALYHELELIGPDPNGASAAWTEDLKREDSDVVGNVLRKTGTSFVARIGGDATGWSKGRYRFVNNTILTMPGGSAVFRLFDQLESVEMHNNVIVTNGTGGPNIMRAAAGEFMWVNGTNIAGSNNWVMTGATNVPTQWTGTLMGNSPGLTNLTSDPRPIVSSSAVVNAGAANPAGPAGFPFPVPLWPPAFHPPLQALIAVGSAMARPSDATIDDGAFELGATTTGTGGTTGGGGQGGSSGRGGSGGAGGATGGRGGTGGSTGGAGGAAAGRGGTVGTGGATAGAGGTSAGAGGTSAGAGGATAGAGGTSAGAGGTAAGGTGGTNGTGVAGAAGGSTGAGGTAQTSSGGCSCDVLAGTPPLPGLLAGAALLIARARRRRSRTQL